MSVYKINRLSAENQIEDIYVFSGLEFSDNPGDLFKKDPTNKMFSNIFDKEELEHIKTNKIRVSFVDEAIYDDDNIGTIKLKLFEAIGREASMSEMYLFCFNYFPLNPVTVYQKLTQNNNFALNKVRLNQLLLNLYDKNGVLINFEEKEQYGFDDILDLRLDETPYVVSKPLGMKNIFEDYPFISNPFLAVEHNSLLDKEIKTLSNNLLLETGPILKNNIYLCLASDVFGNIEKKRKNKNPELASKIYFPFLYSDDIENEDALDENRKQLIKFTLEKMTANTKKTFNNIHLFHQIYKNHSLSRHFSPNKRQTGITFFKAIIYPEFKIKIPIETIFKLIHATVDVPLLKYNPKFRQENLYRLYAPQRTTDGQNIPYLEKSLIFRLIRSIGRDKSVSIYTIIQYNKTSFSVICEFYEDGSIVIYPFTNIEVPIDLNNIDAIIQSAVNPLLEQIQPFFEQSGLEIPLFESVQSPNVEMRDIRFQMSYEIHKKFNAKSIIGCLSSVFTVESKDFTQNILLRYKRVSNYNKNDSQEAFIIEKIDQGLKTDEIIVELIQQFTELNKDDARELVAKIVSEIDVIGAIKKKNKINPGFQTLMKVNNSLSNLTVTVSDITNIQYLNIIPVYIDSIVRIIQDPDSCGVDKENIKKLCSGKELKDIEFVELKPEMPEMSEKEDIIMGTPEDLYWFDMDDDNVS